MSEELKPCPFCMNPAGISITDIAYGLKSIRDLYSVHCTDCLIETKTFFEKQQAIEAWNRRV